MTKILFICISLVVLMEMVWCKPDYAYESLADGWLNFHRIPATWQEAFLRCHYEGAVLISPLDSLLTIAIHTKMYSQSTSKIFLGTHDFHSKGDFFSVEGVPLADMDLSWGGHGLGAEADGDCLTMEIDGNENYIYVSSCEDRHPYICYKKRETDTPLLESLESQCGTFDKEYVLNEKTGSCYKLHQDYQKWPRAYMICAAEGGHLVILNNEEEASIVREMFPDHGSQHINIWERLHIGLRAWDNDRAWMTIHGESLENNFNSWAPHQPDNYMGHQHCGTFLRNGTLDDENCEKTAMFVCEKDPKTNRFERHGGY